MLKKSKVKIRSEFCSLGAARLIGHQLEPKIAAGSHYMLIVSDVQVRSFATLKPDIPVSATELWE